MKKITLYILVLVIFCLQLQPVMAENVLPKDWTISYAGDGAGNIDQSSVFAELTNEAYFDGNTALSVKYPDAVANGNLLIENTLNGTLPEGTYTMSFYARGALSEVIATAGIGEQKEDILESWDYTGNQSGADASTRWRKYTKTFECNGEDKLSFEFSGWTNGCYIDCVSLTDKSGTEYVKNASFEETVTSEEPPVEEPEPELPPVEEPEEEVFDPQIVSGKTIEGWSTLKAAVTTVVGATDYAARTGDWSLCAIFDNSKTYAQEYITNTGATVTLEAGKTYEIGVWANVGEFDEEKLWKRASQASGFVYLGSANNKVDFDDIDTTPTDGWLKYYKRSYTPSSTVTVNISFGFDANYTSYAEDVKVLFDDLYIVEKGSDENLVSGGSFEAKDEEEEPPAEDFLPEINNEEELKGWGSLKLDGGEDKGTRVGPSDYDAKSGDWSLCASFVNGKTWQKEYIQNTGAEVSLKANVEYTYGVWYKTADGINVGKTSAFVCVGGVTDTTKMDLNYIDSVNTVDGWTKYYGKYTPARDMTGYLSFGFDVDFRAVTNMTEISVLFDDLYLYENGSEENLVYNGGFDEFVVDAGYESDTYDPVNFMASPFSGGLAVGWKNPGTKQLKSIKLYDITNGKEVLISDSFDTTPSKINRYKITKLTNGSVYQYKLHVSYRNGVENEYFTYGIPKANANAISPFSVNLNTDNTDGYTATQFMVDANEKHSGEVSLKMISNSTGGSNVFAMLSRSVAVENGENYRLTFWAKAINNNTDLRILNNWKTLDGNSSQEVANFKGTYDWKQFTIDIKEVSTSAIQFFFIFPESCDSLWIDDISLVKMVDGEMTGDELFTDGDFEKHCTNGIVGNISALSAIGGDETAELSWASVSDASKINIYQMTDAGYALRGYLPATATSVKIGHLLNEEEHTFALACVDDNGREGELAEVTVKTVAPDFKVYTPKLYSGKTNLDKIGFGTYTVQTEVRNGGFAEGVPVMQMVALYKGNVLEKLISTEVVAEKLTPADPSTVLSCEITVPEEDHAEYHLEVFVWDSKTERNSLCDFVTFAPAE